MLKFYNKNLSISNTLFIKHLILLLLKINTYRIFLQDPFYRNFIKIFLHMN